MSFESGATPEQVREAYIVNELRSTTPEKLMNMMQGAPTEAARANAEDPEKIKEYMAWEHEWNSLVDSLGSTEESEREKSKLDIKRADLYLTAEHSTLARETLEYALQNAWGQGFDDLAQEIQEKLDSIE